MSNDTSFASVAVVKTCCACGTSVSGQPRMKDSQGRYWCVPCGEAEVSHAPLAIRARGTCRWPKRRQRTMN